MKQARVRILKLAPLLILALGTVLTALLPSDVNADPGATVRVSVDSAGNQANNHSFNASISANGRFVVIHSRASNLVPGDTNGAEDVFVFDRVTGVIERVSVDSAGNQASGGASQLVPDAAIRSISSGGRFVVFQSTAANLVPGDTNVARDIFVHDRVRGLTERVSVDSAGNQANDQSFGSTISANGRFVAIVSPATNLVAGDTNGFRDMFVHDRVRGLTERVSVDSAGNQADDVTFTNASMSGNGRFVAFASDASNLVAGDTNGSTDLFVHDRLFGTTERVSVDSAGNQGTGQSAFPSISANGRFVAFDSDAILVAVDTNGSRDVYIHDRLTGATERVSVDSAGNEGNSASFRPSISPDGRFVAFEAFASNLVSGDTNGAKDVFIHDRLTGVTKRVSVDSAGNQSNGRSELATISIGGHFVAFASLASNLVSGDTNGVRDIFVHQLFP